jgi:hypothetical protein
MLQKAPQHFFLLTFRSRHPNRPMLKNSGGSDQLLLA